MPTKMEDTFRIKMGCRLAAGVESHRRAMRMGTSIEPKTVAMMAKVIGVRMDIAKASMIISFSGETASGYAAAAVAEYKVDAIERIGMT